MQVLPVAGTERIATVPSNTPACEDVALGTALLEGALGVCAAVEGADLGSGVLPAPASFLMNANPPPPPPPLPLAGAGLSFLMNEKPPVLAGAPVSFLAPSFFTNENPEAAGFFSASKVAVRHSVGNCVSEHYEH